MSLNRRQLLAALIASGLMRSGAAEDGPANPPVHPWAIRHRWPTGDTALTPLAWDGARLAFAGARTLGVLSGVMAPQDREGHEPAAVGIAWQQPHGLPGGAAFSPRVAGGLVVCGGHPGLSAWDLATGAPRWRYAARVQVGVPFIDGQRVYCGDGHEIVALDLTTGATLWRFAGVPDTLASYAPVGDGTRLFAGPGDGRLYALSAVGGSPLWVLDRRKDWQYLRQLRLSGEVLVAGSYKEQLYGLDPADGRERWVFNAGNFINSYHVADGTAYLWSPTGWVYAIDTASGQVRWRHRTTDFSANPRNWAPLMAELMTHDGVLYALAMDQILHRLEQANGTALDRRKLSEPVQPCVLPTPVGVFLASRGGDLLLGAVPSIELS